MTAWRAAQAKAQFSEMLDRAETEGPQLVQRRKQRFVVMTEEEAGRATPERSTLKPGEKSVWDVLRAPNDAWLDEDLPKVSYKARAVRL